MNHRVDTHIDVNVKLALRVYFSLSLSLSRAPFAFFLFPFFSSLFLLILSSLHWCPLIQELECMEVLVELSLRSLVHVVSWRIQSTWSALFLLPKKSISSSLSYRVSWQCPRVGLLHPFCFPCTMQMANRTFFTIYWISSCDKWCNPLPKRKGKVWRRVKEETGSFYKWIE